MIISTSSTDRTANSASVPTAGQPAPRLTAPRADQITIESAALLQNALQRQPEIRPEVVARARALASEPGYPPTAVVRMIAQQILASPDLSDDES
jgi:hypothetical protein